MSSSSPAQRTIEAIAKIVDADVPMRILFGRTANLITLFGALNVFPEKDGIVFQPLRAERFSAGGYAMSVEFSAFTDDPALANEACTRLEYLFTTAGVTPNAFAANGAVGACQNPVTQPALDWPPTQSEQDDAAPSRADITLSFLLPD